MTKLKSKPAPIVLFVYNRPWHTEQTVKALQKNELAEQSALIIYSDAPKNEDAVSQVKEVREFLATITGFKSIKVIQRDENWGLAKSIISGVTETVNQYGRVIVLEDDIVTSPAFLSFMNQALEYYESIKKVWHISGWNYPIDPEGLGDMFFWRVMNCWGWATWADRWSHFEKNPKELNRVWSKVKKRHFDLSGSGVFWPQVTANIDGKINTWAIFWYASIYQNQGLCLNPTSSYVENIGHDGSGVHCESNPVMRKNVELSTKKVMNFNSIVLESELAVERIKKIVFGPVGKTKQIVKGWFALGRN